MKIAIVGSSGSGKTTLARRVAARLAIPQVELDAVHHLAGWRPNPEFLNDVAAELDRPDWVCDGNFSEAEAMVRGAADVIVVFDLPRWRVMRQLTKRTLRRAFTREELWNGNREPITNFYRWDPEVNVLRWSWTHHRPNREKYTAAVRSGAWDHAQVVWIRSHADADAWLGSLPSPPIS